MSMLLQLKSSPQSSPHSCRVLRLLAKGQLSPYRAGGDEIYSFFRQAANWAQLLPPRRTFQISARVTSCTDIPSSHLVQIRGRDAICDSIRDARSTLNCQPESCHNLSDLPYCPLLQPQSHCNISCTKEAFMHGQDGANLLQMTQAMHMTVLCAQAPAFLGGQTSVHKLVAVVLQGQQAGPTREGPGCGSALVCSPVQG